MTACQEVFQKVAWGVYNKVRLINQDMDKRERLTRILELSASQARIHDVASADQFIGLLRTPLLLGEADLPPDKLHVVTEYITANLAGGEQLKEFTTQVLAHIPEAIFEEPLSPGTGVDLGDVIALAGFALGKWSFGRKRNPGEELPLAA